MEELGPSELGTLEYWDNRYKTEIKNFASHGDPGEIWFGDDITVRLINWIKKTKRIDPKTSKIIDVGCGNGMLLVDLAKEGYEKLYGVDFSQKAIELSKDVAESQEIVITYFQGDILVGLNDNYDVIHDKGTYDAISLTEAAADKRKKYIENVHKHLVDDGIFIITSCNWTDSELDNHFSEKFIRFEIIPTPQFQFGGSVGSVVSCCTYRKK